MLEGVGLDRQSIRRLEKPRHFPEPSNDGDVGTPGRPPHGDSDVGGSGQPRPANRLREEVEDEGSSTVQP